MSFDFYPRYEHKFLKKSDAEALESDWRKVGGDLRAAMEKVKRDVKETQDLQEDRNPHGRAAPDGQGRDGKADHGGEGGS